MRKTLILSALLTLALWASSYAQLSPQKATSGDFYVRQLISFPPIDSTTVDGAGDPTANESTINDSLWFAMPPFDSPGPWTQIQAWFICHTKDTATATGLCRDSMIVRLQTAWKSDSVKYWRTIATMGAKHPLKAWDSTGSAAARAYQVDNEGTGAGLLTSIPASGAIATAAVEGYGGPYRIPANYRIAVTDVDSTAGDQYRFQILYTAESDSIESHCILRSSPVIHIMEKWIAVIRFHLR